MKIYIVLFFLFFLTSCQTTNTQAGLEQGEDGSVVTAGDTTGENVSDDGAGEGDLESEFADSEDFEEEMAGEAFPSEEGEIAKKESSEEEAAGVDEDEWLDEGEQSESSEEVAQKEEPGTESESTSSDFVESAPLDDSEVVSSEEVGGASSVEGAGVVINNIRYESEKDKIYIDGTGTFSYESRENRENNQFVIEISGATLTESLKEQPFVMKDFNTTMAFLQADQKDSDTVRIVVQMRENAGVPSVSVGGGGSLVISPSGGGSSYADSSGISGGGSGDSFPSMEQGQGGGSSGSGERGTVLPAKSLEDFLLHSPQFTGSLISFEFHDAEVRDVLYFLSDDRGLNLVVSDDVTGKISIRLDLVPWDQALVTIMKTKKLGYLREGNIIRIMTLDALKKDQEDIRKMVENQKVLDPLQVRVIPLVHTKVEDMEKQIVNSLTKDRGKSVSDARSNSLIVTDTKRSIERIETLVKRLDQPLDQVMIETKLVEARETFARSLGVSGSMEFTPFDSGNLSNWPANLGLTVDGTLDTFPTTRAGTGVVGGRTATQSLRVSFAPLGDLDLTLGISEAEGLAHIISAPRVMVLNGEKAKITQSTENISVVTQRSDTTGSSIGTAAQRTPAVLDFEVTPQVTHGYVFMDIKVRREFFGAIADEATRARPVNSRQVETKVLVKNGQTIVIGGIYQHDETKATEGIPILRYIPILKWLFSRFTADNERNELLLFLTPRIVPIKADGAEAN